jgi:hypothetical protein
MQGFVKILTHHQVISDTPKSGKTPRKTERNQSILLKAGVSDSYRSYNCRDRSMLLRRQIIRENNLNSFINIYGKEKWFST